MNCPIGWNTLHSAIFVESVMAYASGLMQTGFKAFETYGRSANNRRFKCGARSRADIGGQAFTVSMNPNYPHDVAQ